MPDDFTEREENMLYEALLADLLRGGPDADREGQLQRRLDELDVDRARISQDRDEAIRERDLLQCRLTNLAAASPGGEEGDDVRTDGKGWLVVRERARGYERAKGKLDELGVTDTACNGSYHASAWERIQWLADDLAGCPHDPLRTRTRGTAPAAGGEEREALIRRASAFVNAAARAEHGFPERDRIIETLERIVKNDQTTMYAYSEARMSDGEEPPAGERWATPREMAVALLRDLKGGPDDA